MAENFLPSLPEHLQKKDLTIAVVTHSHFLKAIPELNQNCNHTYLDKPKNNQVFELKYHFTTKRSLEHFPVSNISKMHINHDFKFEEGSGCKSLIEVQGKQTQSCEQDFGEVCKAELAGMSRMVRPKLKF